MNAIITTSHINNAASTANNAKYAIIALPNRKVACGEYGANYGFGSTHDAIFSKRVTFTTKQAARIAVEESGEHTYITIHYSGKIGKRNQEEIADMVNLGFIEDIVY